MRAPLLTLTLALIGCAETTHAIQPRGPRTGADDSDLWNVVPGDVDALADVDLAKLRASPWSQSLMQGDLDGDRESRRQRFGYDVFTEAERMLLATNKPTGDPSTLTIARGRFEMGRIASAFQSATLGATTTQWRDSPLVEGQGHAVTLVTPRTIAHGDGPRVRAAVDAAWGMVPDASAGPLGELRRTLDADKNPPAATLAISLNDEMRAQAAGVVAGTDGLRRIGARLDLGEDLNLEALAVFDTGGHAATAAAMWSEAARTFARQRTIVLLGFGPLFDGLTVGAEGARVHVRLHIAADRREGLAEKVVALLQLMAKARH